MASDRDPLIRSNGGGNTNNATGNGNRFGGMKNRRSSSIFLPRSFDVSKHVGIVEYNGDNHIQVLLQMHGSVWDRVLPWCLAVCLETLAIIILRKYGIVDLTVSNAAGHNFMSLLVSFLLVTRATITYNRFMEARQHLSDLYRSSREVVQYACVLTSTNTNPAAVEWRRAVAYKCSICLRMAAAAVEFQSMGVPAWDTLPESDQNEMELLVSTSSFDLTEPTGGDSLSSINENSASSLPYSHQDAALFLDLAHGPRTMADENFRAPIIWSYNLRQQILKTRSPDSTTGGPILEHRPMHVNEELRILALVSDFLAAFHGHRKLITTPFPFPMVQMTRTFLFFWVFSLPLVLVAVSDDDRSTNSYSLHDTIEVLLILFVCTYGFLGLEFVSVELDDPYGYVVWCRQWCCMLRTCQSFGRI